MLLNVKSLGEINHVFDISNADINACMTYVRAVSEQDIDLIGIPKIFAEFRMYVQREKWRVACQAEKDALAKMGVRLLCKTPNGVTPIPTRWVYTIKSDGCYNALSSTHINITCIIFT